MKTKKLFIGEVQNILQNGFAKWFRKMVLEGRWVDAT